MRLKHIVLLILFIIFSTEVFPQSDEIKEINIDSRWAGWEMEDDQITITSKDGAFYLDDQVVSNRLIEDLISALNEPKKSVLDVSSLELDMEGLKGFVKHAQKAFHPEIALNDTETMDVINKAVHAYYFESFHTDDYPNIEIQIVYQDGRTLDIYTESQKICLLPWVMSKMKEVFANEADDADLNFNVNISKALYAILPEGFLNKERLSTSSSIHTLHGFDGIPEQIVYIVSDEKTFFLPEAHQNNENRKD